MGRTSTTSNPPRIGHRPRGKWLLMVSAFATLSTLGGPSRAGCPTVCTGSAHVTVMPPLSCATFDVAAQDCYCTAFVSVTNACSDAIEATDFTFTGCATSDNCHAIEPQTNGALKLQAQSAG